MLKYLSSLVAPFILYVLLSLVFHDPLLSAVAAFLFVVGFNYAGLVVSVGDLETFPEFVMQHFVPPTVMLVVLYLLSITVDFVGKLFA